MITIIDYGMGNLHSVQKAFEAIGAQAVIVQEAKQIKSADKIVLPGVGAMACAMDRLNELGLVPAIREVITQGKPFLGICLGMQLLFNETEEGGKIRGLGILAGSVKKFRSLKVPQIGWNQVQNKNSCKLFNGIEDKSFVYFCHSYYCQPEDTSLVAAQTNYGIDYASAVCKGNIWGVQFHPEKSQEVGLRILKNFSTF
ncbi:MAG: imidazole glycerol phosphate synthase subunit HisH [Candidatus Omnitrophota bacterium]|nr:imidazole glycerol phosphate synthase subunit HisH [Candidatus Omnitrophota bacterium]